MKHTCLLLITSLLSVLLCLGLCSCSVTPYTYLNASDYTVGGATLSAEDSASVTSVNVDWVLGEVEVIRETDETVTSVSFSETCTSDISEAYTMRYLVKDGTLYIRFCAPGALVLSVRKEKKLTLRLPASMDPELVTLSTASADIRSADLPGRELDIDTASGKIDLHARDAEKIRIDTASGDIALTVDSEMRSLSVNSASGKMDISLKNSVSDVDLDTASGKITLDCTGAIGTLDVDSASAALNLEAVKIEKLDVDTASGDLLVRADQLIDAKVNSASGRVTMDLGTVPANCDIETASGEVTLTLPATPGFTAHISKASGDFESDIPLTHTGNTYTCGDASGRIDIDTASGSIRLYEKK